MSVGNAELIAATERLLADRIDDATIRRARSGAWPAAAWTAIEEMGLPLALVDETGGGIGIALEDGLALIRLCGRHAAPLPIAETMIANRVLAGAGLPLAEGPAGIVPCSADIRLTGDGKARRLSGHAERIAWGRDAKTLIVEAGDGRVMRLASGWTVVGRETNLAAMPRDMLRFDALVLPESIAAHAGPDLKLLGAATRALLIAGALERVLDLTVAHVSDRVQFGRPLAKFQAIQQELAKLAGQVAAARAAADIAADAIAGPTAEAMLPIAAARVRGGEAVGIAVGIAHQLHGAIGFTEEHRLHLFTTALWAWRDEFGAQPEWAGVLGDAALAAGPDGFWPFVVAA